MKTKYVLAKGYYGMGGNIAVMLCALRLARETDRRRLVDWVDGVYHVEGEDVFKLLFESPSYELPREALASLRVWPTFWQPYVTETMPYPDDVPLTRVRASQAVDEGLEHLSEYDVWMVTRDDRYWHDGMYREETGRLAQELVLVRRLRQRIASFHAHEMGDDAIAVHFRHGNGEPTVVPPDIQWFFGAVDEFLKRSPGSRIFVCTDCKAVLDRFTDRYDRRIVATAKEYPPLGSGAMHSKYTKQDGLEHQNGDRLVFAYPSMVHRPSAARRSGWRSMRMTGSRQIRSSPARTAS